jgi:hypothetical protein
MVLGGLRGPRGEQESDLGKVGHYNTYNPDVVIGTESWLSQEINSAEIFRDDYITLRRDRCSRGGGVK